MLRTGSSASNGPSALRERSAHTRERAFESRSISDVRIPSGSSDGAGGL